MRSRAQGIDSIWPDIVPIIGMIHLLPLPGAPGWSGSMKAVLERALADAEALVEAGFHGLIVENLVGSGITAKTVPTYLSHCDGLIVGSAVMRGGVAGAGVDPERAAALMAAATG